MSWMIGYDDRHKRDIGYGVPCECDHPECGARINRGISYVCGGEPFGGERGCGLYFCDKHRSADGDDLCARCASEEDHFPLKPDLQEWITHKLTDPTWENWRLENPDFVKLYSGEK